MNRRGKRKSKGNWFQNIFVKLRLRDRIALICAPLILLVILIVIVVRSIPFEPAPIPQEPMARPDLDVQLLTPNPYSRPQFALEEINGIVIHYVANPGTSAQQNRNFFENLKDGSGPRVSSHFIVGLEGEIIQCIPSSEIAYASNFRNSDTLSIETCHPDWTGKFTEVTYDSLVHLTAWLCERFGLESEAVIRHFDVNGKLCPLYYVEDEEAWVQFRQDVQDYMDHYEITEEDRAVQP